MHAAGRGPSAGRYGHGQMGMGAAARTGRSTVVPQRRARSEGKRSASTEKDRQTHSTTPRGRRSISQGRSSTSGGHSRPALSPSSRSMRSTGAFPQPSAITNISRRQNILTQTLSPKKYNHQLPTQSSLSQVERSERHGRIDPGEAVASTNQAAVKVMQRVKRLMNVLEGGGSLYNESPQPPQQLQSESKVNLNSNEGRASADPSAHPYFMSKATAEIMKKYATRGSKTGGTSQTQPISPKTSHTPPVNNNVTSPPLSPSPLGPGAIKYKPYYSTLQQAVEAPRKGLTSLTGSQEVKDMREKRAMSTPSNRGFSPPPRSPGLRRANSSGMPSPGSSILSNIGGSPARKISTSGAQPRLHQRIPASAAPHSSARTYVPVSQTGSRTNIDGNNHHKMTHADAEAILDRISQKLLASSLQPNRSSLGGPGLGSGYRVKFKVPGDKPIAEQRKKQPQPYEAVPIAASAAPVPPVSSGPIEKRLEYSREEDSVEETAEISQLDLSGASRAGRGEENLPTEVLPEQKAPKPAEAPPRVEVAWPIEPSPMRDEFLLTDKSAVVDIASPRLPSRSPEVATPAAEAKDFLQAPAVSPSVATTSTAAAGGETHEVLPPSPPSTSADSPQHSNAGSGASPPASAQGPPLSPPRQIHAGSSPLSTPPTPPAKLREGVNEATPLSLPISALRHSECLEPLSATKPSLDKRVFSPPPSPPKRGHLEEESLHAPDVPVLMLEQKATRAADAPDAMPSQHSIPTPKKPTSPTPAEKQAKREALWLEAAAALYGTSGLPEDADLTTVSTVISSKMTEPQEADARQMIGDTVAQAVGVARKRLDFRDRLPGCSFNRVPARSLASQMKSYLVNGHEQGRKQQLVDEVVKICKEWCEEKLNGDIHGEALARKETRETARYWKLSSADARKRVVDSWTDVVISYLLHDTIEHFNKMEIQTQRFKGANQTQ